MRLSDPTSDPGPGPARCSPPRRRRGAQGPPLGDRQRLRHRERARHDRHPRPDARQRHAPAHVDALPHPVLLAGGLRLEVRARGRRVAVGRGRLGAASRSRRRATSSRSTRRAAGQSFLLRGVVEFQWRAGQQGRSSASASSPRPATARAARTRRASRRRAAASRARRDRRGRAERLVPTPSSRGSRAGRLAEQARVVGDHAVDADRLEPGDPARRRRRSRRRAGRPRRGPRRPGAARPGSSATSAPRRRPPGSAARPAPRQPALAPPAPSRRRPARAVDLRVVAPDLRHRPAAADLGRELADQLDRLQVLRRDQHAVGQPALDGCRRRPRARSPAASGRRRARCPRRRSSAKWSSPSSSVGGVRPLGVLVVVRQHQAAVASARSTSNSIMSTRRSSAAWNDSNVLPGATRSRALVADALERRQVARARVRSGTSGTRTCAGCRRPGRAGGRSCRSAGTAGPRG